MTQNMGLLLGILIAAVTAYLWKQYKANHLPIHELPSHPPIIRNSLTSIAQVTDIKSLEHIFRLVSQERGADYSIGAEIGFMTYATPQQEQLSETQLQILNIQLIPPALGKESLSTNLRWAGMEYGQLLAETLQDSNPTLFKALQLTHPINS